MRWLLILSILTSNCAAHRFECERHGGGPVLRVESDHFVVTSDLPEHELGGQVRQLERLWDAYAVFFQSEPATITRTPVILSEAGAASEFIPGAGGFFAGAIEPMVFSTLARGDGRKTSSSDAHELVHLVSRAWLPNQPRWLAEGLATYLGDAEFQDERVVRFGRWQWSNSADLLPLAELWAWDFEVPDRAKQHALYQSAWAWVHYLSNRDEARLTRLWVELRTRPSAREAFDAVFPPSEHAALEAKVQAYVDEARFRGWQSTTLRAPAVSRAVPVEAWDVHLLRRRVFQRTGLFSDVRRESRLAKEVSPAATPPLVELAVLQDTVYGPERTDGLKRLSALPEARVQLGYAPDLRPDEQFAHLAQAAAEQPDSAIAQLSFALAANERRDTRGLDAARRALALAPWSLDVRLAFAHALAVSGQCAEGFSALESATSLGDEGAPSTPHDIADARRRVAQACERAK